MSRFLLILIPRCLLIILHNVCVETSEILTFNVIFYSIIGIISIRCVFRCANSLRVSSYPFGISTHQYMTRVFLLYKLNSLHVCIFRFLWRPVDPCVPELLYGGHGAAAPRSVSATKPYPAPASPILLRTLSAGKRALWSQHSSM